MTYLTKPKLHHPALKKNEVGYTRRDYEGAISTLCAGCGHDSISAAAGREFNLNGFLVVDVEKFVALPEATVIEWHRSGWLALIHQHLMSLGRFNDLTRRQVERLAA